MDKALLRRSFFDAARSGDTWGPAFIARWQQQQGLPRSPAPSKIEAYDLRELILEASHRENHTVDTSDYPNLTIDERGIRIAHFDIGGAVFDLSSLRFELPIKIEGCRFDGIIRIEDAHVGRMLLRDCEFDSLFGQNSHFGSNLEITDCTVSNRLWLVGTEIGGHLDLENTKINETGELVDTFTIAERTVTDEWRRCLRCEGAKIHGSLLMRRGFFSRGRISLRRAEINGVVRTQEAELAPLPAIEAAAKDRPTITLDFRGATVHGTLDLTNVRKFRGGIDLRDCNAQAFAHDDTAWPTKGTLLLDGFIYQRLTDSRDNVPTRRDYRWRKKWLMLQYPPDLGAEFKPQPWTQTARVLNEMGHDRSARLVLFEREEQRLKKAKMGQRTRLFRRMLGWLAGHGYKTHRALLAAGAAWLVFACVAIIAAGSGIINPAQEEVLVAHGSNRIIGQCYDRSFPTDKIPASYPEFNAWVYSADVLVPIVDLRQTEFWRIRGTDECDVGRILNTQITITFGVFPRQTTISFSIPISIAAIIAKFDIFRLTQWSMIAVGWILSTVAVAGFTGLLERDKI